MIPLKLKKDIADTSIPRESGDDPYAVWSPGTKIRYSPRERG